MIGVLADDTTGANDIGVAYQKGGASVIVVAHEEKGCLDVDEDVLVIDTNSRLDSQSIAYEKVCAATQNLQAAGCRIFHKKTCSAVRGHIGAEFDALLDSTGLTTMIVSIAYPKNGRTTIQGKHFVHGKLLEETNFKEDPVHPMHKSSLVEIIREQSSRPSMVVPITEVRRGVQNLRNYLEALAHQFTYLVVDGETQEDIAILAEAASGFSAFGGSAALGEELPRFLGKMKGPKGIDATAISGSGACLVVCGSLTPQTREQTARFLATGVDNAEFDSMDVFDPERCEEWVEKTASRGRQVLAAGHHFLLFASQNPDAVAATKKQARELCLDDAALGKRMSAVQAEAAARILDGPLPHPLIIAGGDTSGSICERMGIKGNRILEEIDTGVPIGQTLTNPRLIVLKSGSFGKPDFLIRATNRARALSVG